MGMKYVVTEYLALLNRYGPFSTEDVKFFNTYFHNAEIIELLTEIRLSPSKYIPTVLLPGGILPCRKHNDDLGLDVFATEHYDLMPGEGNRFLTGVKMALPNGGLLRDKSSSSYSTELGFRGVIVCGGVIDPSYRGEILVVLYNLGKNIFEIRPGKAFVQLIAEGIPIEVLELLETARGERGFGDG